MENNIMNDNFSLPIIPLEGVVPFPDTSMSIEIKDATSFNTVSSLNVGSKAILGIKKSSELPSNDFDSYVEICVLGTIRSSRLQKNNNIKLIVDGEKRIKLIDLKDVNGKNIGNYNIINENNVDEAFQDASLRIFDKLYNEISNLRKMQPLDAIETIINSDNIIRIINILTPMLVGKFEAKLNILSTVDTKDRIELLISELNNELEIAKIENRISQKVRSSFDKTQNEYYLREHIKAMSEELGDGTDDIEEYKKKIASLKIKDKAIIKRLNKEINRLSKLPPQSPESGILRGYVDWVCDLPWNKTTRDTKDIKKAKEILNQDHYGLDDVKERILEFLSVQMLTNSVKGPILCLVGPPGVGKTSIAHSVARAMNRNFVRMSLGGIRDEAEIRGHRRTYVGAMPGRIIYNMRNSSTINPVFLLDEIDKMTSDFRGDPSSALLEVLDPEINSTFRDNYLEIPYNLSKVFFITTANSLETIPLPLLDRMEIIEISGYTDEEKTQIAKKYLIPKQAKSNGLAKSNIVFSDEAILSIIHGYTRESGVRNLEREIANVFRKIALNYAIDKNYIEKNKFIDSQIEDILGLKKFKDKDKISKAQIGKVTGLAWTSVGGVTLNVEATILQGKGDVILTGKLGDVMKESARIAYSYIHSQSDRYNISEELFSKKDIHIHVPEGATPKDGPSAGITLATAILSALTGKKVDGKVAMTGEITLLGNVLPIGGIKEKILAAHRAGVTMVIIPKKNEKDLDKLPKNIRKKLKFVLVENAAEVFEKAIKGLSK